MSNAMKSLPENVGPGSYIAHSKYELKPHAAPFNGSVIRSKPLKKDNAPGPGSYNVEFIQEG